MQISVIIPTYNRAKQLEECLESLFNQNFNKNDFEIIIVDDGSIDDTAKLVTFLQKSHTNLKYFKQENKGPAATRNLGIKKAKGNILAFTDDDCIVSKDWLVDISKSNCHIIGGKTDTHGYATSLVFQYLTELSIWEKGEIVFFPTNNLGIRRYIFDKVGLFDETNHNAAGEDTEWCWRTLKKGFNFEFNRDMKVSHNYNPSLKDFIRKSYRYGKGNYCAKLKCLEHPKLEDIKINSGFYFQVFKNFIKSFNFAYVHSGHIKIKWFSCFCLLVFFVWAYNLGLIKQHRTKHRTKS